MNVADRDLMRAGFAAASASPSTLPRACRALREAAAKARFAKSNGDQRAINEFTEAMRALLLLPPMRNE